jgi:hypothetical protein
MLILKLKLLNSMHLIFVAQREHNPNYSRPTFIRETNNLIQNFKLPYIFTQMHGLKLLWAVCYVMYKFVRKSKAVPMQAMKAY